MAKVVKTIPSSEDGAGMVCTTRSGQEYRITQNRIKQRFSWWRKVSDGFELLGTAASPVELDEKIPWEE